MEDPIKVHREAIKISDDRNMYLYTFDLDGEPMTPMSLDDVEVSAEADAPADSSANS